MRASQPRRRAVQVDCRMPLDRPPRCAGWPQDDPGLTALGFCIRAWFQTLKLKYDEPLSDFTFDFNWRSYTAAIHNLFALQLAAHKAVVSHARNALAGGGTENKQQALDRR